MTTFEDVKVGDRVRLTHKNGDLAEFTVNCVYRDELYSLVSVYDEEDGWQTEILETPLPTKHGALIGHPTESRFVQFLRSSNRWQEVADGDANPTTEAYVRQAMRENGFVVLFPGIDV